MAEDKIILGIDPGTTILGYGLIHIQNKKIELLNFGVVQLQKLENQADKLKRICDRIDGIMDEYKPDEMAIEAPFFGKNVQSMLKLGRAQGAAIVAGASNNIEVIEYSPRRIKQSITGRGNASKEQVAKMLQSTLQLTSLPKYFDETDALAVAVCHINASKKIAVTGKQFKNWNDFIQANPGKVK